jgi:uncharacterized protein DUF1579
MRSSRVLFLSLLATLAAAPAVRAQAAGEAPPMPKPGPEHELFKQDAGTWDATVESWMAPGAPPMTSKGVETNALGCGGLCLVSSFKGDFGGIPFDGHGTSAYDSTKKKYVGSWTDSMSSGLAIGESTYDPAKKVVTGYMEGPDMTGKVIKSKAVVEYKADGSRVFTMYNKTPDGKEVPGMRITYVKRK